MGLRFVVPNMEKTFGNLEFAGENTTEQQRINGRMAVINRRLSVVRVLNASILRVPKGIAVFSPSIC